MGVYDCYGENGIQIKAGSCLMRNYTIGEKSDLEDGIYVAHDGIVIIKNGIFIADFREDKIFTKWGENITDNIKDILSYYYKRRILGE